VSLTFIYKNNLPFKNFCFITEWEMSGEGENWKVPGKWVEKAVEKNFFCFLPLKNSIERDLKKSEERNLAKFSWKFSVIFWLSWALNCHASIRMVSIRARLLLKMSKSKRTRKHTLVRFSLSLSHPIVVTILRENFAISKAKDFLNLVNYLKINFIMQNLSLMFHARMIHGSIHISSNIFQFQIHSQEDLFTILYIRIPTPKLHVTKHTNVPL